MNWSNDKFATLLKNNAFISDMEYYQSIVESILNGNLTDAKHDFKKMPRANRIAMVKAITIGNWHSELSNKVISDLFDLI